MPQYRNPTKRPVTLTLVHEDAPRKLVAFDAPVHDPKTGEMATRQIERRLPESITVLGGETRELPKYAKKAALAAGLVAVEAQADSAAPKPADDQPAQDNTAPRPADDRPSEGGGGEDPLPNALKRKKGA